MAQHSFGVSPSSSYVAKKAAGGGSVEAVLAAIRADFQAAGDDFKDKLNQEMEQSIRDIVYGAGVPDRYIRTETYLQGWKQAEKTGSGSEWSVESHYHPTGAHPSWWDSADVTGGLDEIVIEQGSHPQVISFANEPRDHFLPVDDKAEQLAWECIKSRMG